jgi:hypothetical protein
MATKGINKKFRISLDTARAGSGEKISVIGRRVIVSDASGTDAIFYVAIEDNNEIDFFKMKYLGRLGEPDQFSQIYIRNTAQPGKWVEIIITDGEEDFEYELPSETAISSISSVVTVEVGDTVNAPVFTRSDAEEVTASSVAVGTTAVSLISGDTKTEWVKVYNDGATDLNVGHSTGTIATSFFVIPPYESDIFYTSDTIVGVRPSGSGSYNARVIRGKTV